MNFLKTVLGTVLATMVLAVHARAAEPVTLRIGVLRGPEPLSISRLRGTLPASAATVGASKA